MKKKYLFAPIFIVFFQLFSSQLIINIDSLQRKYPMKKYTLNTKELYNFDKTIEIYNFFISKNKILLITILPNFQGKENWVKLDKNVIDDGNPTNEKLDYWLNSENPKDKKLLYKKVTKSIDENQYASVTSLIEIFNIGNYPYPLLADFGTINILENKTSIREMYEIYEELYSKNNLLPIFPLDVRETEHIKTENSTFLFRNYLSKEYMIGKEKAYQFWTFISWDIVDGYNQQRGIDRFVYIPEKGIVGGSYDFYFALKPRAMVNNDVLLPVSEEKLWDNIINEKIMLAKEIK